tara:strand:+ start:213177 stop:213515 length:339 start_codon:yes stop_codon:yes gene_type:complete
MVKIRELTDPQLSSQIKKYRKILDELEKEKAKRQEATGEVKTPEKEEFQVSFDEDEISQMQENVAKEKVKEQESEEQIRVTQLLTLSKDQLKELQENSKKLKNTKKKKITKK